ncbi:MAG TPA: 50S ribosomal protein L24, partial [Nitrospirae bacterium]|nr:50S ribosomal protein L24 [Nitrospirota bacterium]
KKNDIVMVVAGDEKSKKGRVIAILNEGSRLFIENVNMIKKHMKPNKQYSQGGIIEKEAPVHRSNIMLVCPKCDRPTKIGNKILENGKKIRECRKCGEVIE